MCRILAYLGEPLPVRNLLFDPDNSLVRQSYSPRMMNTFLNLAGFGMKAWDPTSLRPEDPFTYRVDDAAVVRPQPALHLVQARADVHGRPCSRGHVLRRGRRRRHEPAPVPLPRRPRRPGAQRAPAAVRAHALLARRARAPGRRAVHRGHDRLRVDLRARPVAARRPVRRCPRRASWPMPPPARCASCARSARHTASTRPRRSTSASAPAASVVATRLSFDYGWYPPEDEMLETDLPFVSLWYAIGGEYADRDGDWQMTAGDPPRSVIIASEPLTTDVSTLARGAGVLDADRGAHSRRARVRDARPAMSERETVDFLATVPLLEGRDEADLAQLARMVRRRTVPAGEVLWRQGDDGARAGVRRRRRGLGLAARAGGSQRRDRPSRARGDCRRDRAARRRRAHDERARDGDRDGARARPAGLRSAARRPASVGVRAASAGWRRSSPRACATSSSTSLSRSAVGRRPARPRTRNGRWPTWRSARRPTASTCAAWRRSTTSSQWRSGAS